MRNTASNPPSNAQPGETKACSAQQIAPHISAVLKYTPDPRLMKRDLAKCQRQSLRHRVFGMVGGLHGDVKCFEVLPCRGRWVGQPMMGKGVGHQQVTELIVNARRGDPDEGQQQSAAAERAQEYQHDGREFRASTQASQRGRVKNGPSQRLDTNTTAKAASSMPLSTTSRRSPLIGTLFMSGWQGPLSRGKTSSAECYPP